MKRRCDQVTYPQHKEKWCRWPDLNRYAFSSRRFWDSHVCHSITAAYLPCRNHTGADSWTEIRADSYGLSFYRWRTLWNFCAGWKDTLGLRVKNRRCPAQWWSIGDSNPGHSIQAGALPTELMDPMIVFCELCGFIISPLKQSRFFEKINRFCFR